MPVTVVAVDCAPATVFLRRTRHTMCSVYLSFLLYSHIYTITHMRIVEALVFVLVITTMCLTVYRVYRYMCVASSYTWTKRQSSPANCVYVWKWVYKRFRMWIYRREADAFLKRERDVFLYNYTWFLADFFSLPLHILWFSLSHSFAFFLLNIPAQKCSRFNWIFFIILCTRRVFTARQPSVFRCVKYNGGGECNQANNNSKKNVKKIMWKARNRFPFENRLKFINRNDRKKANFWILFWIWIEKKCGCYMNHDEQINEHTQARQNFKKIRFFSIQHIEEPIKKQFRRWISTRRKRASKRGKERSNVCVQEKL